MTTEAPRLREVTPDGTLKLHLHRGQWDVWQSLVRFVFMMAGTQSGKTSFIPHWLHREIVKEMGKVGKGEPVGDFIALSSNYDQFKLKMLPEILEVFVGILKIGRWWAGERVLELTDNLEPNGRYRADKQDDPMYGRIILRSAEALSGLESLTAKAAVLDEVGQKEFTLDAWEAVLRRLSLSQGRVLGTTTLYNYGWLKFEVFDEWKKGNPHFAVIQFDSIENPVFPPEEYERAKASMPAWKFNMLYRGQYDKPAGLVYDCFDESQCVMNRFIIPPHWLWYVGHDFGGANPAALMYAQDPGTGIFYLVHEYLPSAKPVADQVDDLKAKLKGRFVVRRQGGSLQEVGWRDLYTAQGWPIAEPPVKNVDVGIARVYAFHKRNAIMVFRDCTHYLDEKMSYSYKLGTSYEVLDEIENKSRYHLMDAERGVLCGFSAEGVHGEGPSQLLTLRF